MPKKELALSGMLFSSTGQLANYINHQECIHICVFSSCYTSALMNSSPVACGST